jgi:hypothetical protein
MLVMEELDRKEIKKRIKSALRSVPSDATLALHPPMRPDDGFIEMVSARHPPPFSQGLFAFPFHHLTRWSGGLQGNLCLVPNFNPPLPEDMTQRTRNWAHAKGVKKKKDEEKKKKAGKARGRRSARSARVYSGRLEKKRRS